jgi:hypothetical protein
MMAFSESLAGHIREVRARKNSIEGKKMFGGVGFLLNGNMPVESKTFLGSSHVAASRGYTARGVSSLS